MTVSPNLHNNINVGEKVEKLARTLSDKAHIASRSVTHITRRSAHDVAGR